MRMNIELSTQSDNWLTVSEAAVALKISDRAVQKRCALGKMQARRIETPQGTRWEIDPNQFERTSKPVRRERANQRTEPANQIKYSQEENHANLDANVRTESRERTDELGREPTNQTRDLEAHLLEENRFLRAAIEQHQRSEAELRAALRTALAAMPKALPTGDVSSTRNEADISSQNHQESPLSSETGKVTREVLKASPAKVAREMRPLWKVILGIR